MKIYTKTGDQGDTKLLYGDTVPKDSLAPEAYGSVDELVASLGLIRADEKLPIEIKEILLWIQRELFIVGAELATAKEKSVLVVAHGNSIRAMVKILDNLSDKEIVEVNIPTGIPLAYNISDNNIEKIGYLGDEETINNLAKEVEMQSKITDKKG